MLGNDFDYEKIEERVKQGNIKLIEIQRSKGYSTRKSISIEKLENIINDSMFWSSSNREDILRENNNLYKFYERGMLKKIFGKIVTTCYIISFI